MPRETAGAQKDPPLPTSRLSGRSPVWPLATILSVYVVLTARFWFVCDDAYISFRFARNWAHGLGLVFNPGEFPPVEGYSNLLWVLLAAGLEVVGAAPAVVLPVVSAACGAVLVWRVHEVAQRVLGLGDVPALVAALSVAASPAIGVWATSGLATMPQALLIFLLAEAWVLPPPPGPSEPRDAAWPALIASALCLLRTEGIGWVALVALTSVLRHPPGPARQRHLGALGASLVAPLGVWLAYTGWRFAYYGTVWPHIAVAKLSPGLRALGRGARYVVLFWLTGLVPALSLAPAGVLIRGGDGRRWAAVTALALAFPAYAMLVGGDFMPFGRLLVPGLPFAALLLGGGFAEAQRRGASLRALAAAAGALLVVQALPAGDLHLVPEGLRRLAHFRLSDKTYLSEANRWLNQKENLEGFVKRGRALAQVAEPEHAVVAAAVGAVGYHSGLEVFDQHGLVTAEVGYRPVPEGPLTRSPGHDKHVEPEYFVKYEPTFLYARAVQGKLAAGRMKDTLEQWSVDPLVMDRYVPDFYEVAIPGEPKRTFLLVVRRRAAHEDPLRLWDSFPARRRALNAELRAQYADDPDDLDDDPG